MQPLFNCRGPPRVIEDDCLNNALFVSLYWELCGSVGSQWITILQPWSRRLISLLRQATLPFCLLPLLFKQLVKLNDFKAALRLQPDNQRLLWRITTASSATASATTIIGNANLKLVYNSSVIIIISGNNIYASFFSELDEYKLHSAAAEALSRAQLLCLHAVVWDGNCFWKRPFFDEVIVFFLPHISLVFTGAFKGKFNATHHQVS